MPKIISEKGLQTLLGRFIKEYRFIGPIKKDVETGFGEIKNLNDLVSDYTNTIEPPKFVLLLPEETLFSYKMSKDVGLSDNVTSQKQMIFGVRPCDVHGIRMMDKVFKENFDDPYYQAKRNSTIIFAVTCTKVSDFCFCQSWGTGPSLKEGYDLLLTNLGDRYLLETGSKIGSDLIKDMNFKEASPNDLKDKDAVIKATEAKFTRKVNTENIEEIMISKPDHPSWKDNADRCLSCGNCTSVCPTCYCFDVNERIDYDATSVERYRLWDSCQLLEYSQVALGGNFRKQRITRLKQFMCHKFSFSLPQYGDHHCVGCGRCIKWCPVDIDITKVAKDLRGE